ncbi:hypothetical protein IV203_014966 [Nitzschia inconspicua]|uniref:Uncharacterized protein n=1 Tax=Nitzschia inconspicua TaxID=303405 RepID=A0A9K3PT28_9STRA|nr:hypothetical protein IV203_014966 [Nitzschia inconspicua]
MKKLFRRCSKLAPFLLLTVCITWQTRSIIISNGLIRVMSESPEEQSLTILAPSTKHRALNDRNHRSPDHPRRLLIIAAAPKDERHVWTVWTELECFTRNVDHVIISSPHWGHDITNYFVREAQRSIPWFVNQSTTIEAQNYVNDRYDVGLWCDALEHTSMNKDCKNNVDFDEIGLLNDSVFALRESTAVFNALKERNVSLSSLSYSFSPKNFRGRHSKEHFWVESVFRGLTPRGVKLFQNHSCLHTNHHKFCRGRSPEEQKGCIINNFEHDLAAAFPEGDVFGFYESDAPPETKVRPYKTKMSWASNFLYWQKLVNESAFPVAKENVKESIPDIDTPLLKNCTRYLKREKLKSWNLDFSVAETTFLAEVV